MSMESVWIAGTPDTQFPALEKDIEADVAIIGGGITGLTAALLLSQAGKRVVVLEAMSVGMGTSGFSTGNLYAPVDQHLFKLKEKWGEDKTTAVVNSRLAAMEQVEKTIQDFNIECDFQRRPWHLYTPSSDDKSLRLIEQEYEAASQLGLDAVLLESLPLPFPIRKAVKIDNQAQFNPLQYVRGLAGAIDSENCRIFEHTRALAVDDDKGVIETAQGKVRCGKIVVATHTPAGFYLVHSELGPYREYALALRLKDDAYPVGIFWSPGLLHSLRSYAVNGRSYLIALGSKHKTGQSEDASEHYRVLENEIRVRFQVEEVAYRWSAQHYRPADDLPYIGLSPATANTYIATGYATDGLVYGTLAAMIISDALLNRENPFADLYRASRFTPVKSAMRFLKENADVASEYIKDFAKVREGSLESVQPGTGKILTLDGKRLAVYRDDEKAVHALSPFCPHMKCMVHWNTAEKTWDCPCHGSRFSATGACLEGPALNGLAQEPLPAAGDGQASG